LIVKVYRWKTLAELLWWEQNLETSEKMEAALTELMIGLGAKLEAPSAKPKTGERCHSPGKNV
jgi:hypothetical protein